MPFESTGPASVIPLSEQTYRDRNGLADIYGDGNMGGGLADIGLVYFQIFFAKYE